MVLLLNFPKWNKLERLYVTVNEASLVIYGFSMMLMLYSILPVKRLLPMKLLILFTLCQYCEHRHQLRG